MWHVILKQVYEWYVVVVLVSSKDFLEREKVGDIEKINIDEEPLI